MDPQRTMYDLMHALSLNDREEVDRCLEDLQEWNLNGGFLPQVFGPNSEGAYRVYATYDPHVKSLGVSNAH